MSDYSIDDHIKHRADLIRTWILGVGDTPMVSTLYGVPVSQDDPDAMLVAAYELGRKDGKNERNNSSAL